MRFIAASMSLCALVACGGGGGTGSPKPPTVADFSLAISAPAVAADVGSQSGSVTVTRDTGERVYGPGLCVASGSAHWGAGAARLLLDDAGWHTEL